MTSADGSRLVALVAAAPSVTTDDRAVVLDRLRAIGDGGIVVATCHRVEAYAVEPAATIRTTADATSGTAPVLHGIDAARHAISLAVGLESAVLAEDQVLHQVRTSVAAARRRARLDPELETLFRLALTAGRRARSWRIGRPRSLADVALDRAEAETGSLAGREVLVVGTGEMGRLTAHAAAARGARILVGSRTPGRATMLAAAVGGEDVPFDPGDRIGSVAAVIVALAGPWGVGDRTVAATAHVPVVIDLSQPRAVDRRLEPRRLVQLDDLLVDAASGGDPSTERLREDLEALRDATLERFVEWLDAGSGRAVTGTLASAIERDREAVLENLWRRRPDLAESDRREIEELTRHLADRLFREPFQRLASDTDGRRERAARELFGL